MSPHLGRVESRPAQMTRHGSEPQPGHEALRPLGAIQKHRRPERGAHQRKLRCAVGHLTPGSKRYAATLSATFTMDQNSRLAGRRKRPGMQKLLSG